MYIKRTLEKTIDQYWQEREFLALVGPRQVGKTTLLQRLMTKYKGKYLSFEDPNILDLFNNDIAGFCQTYLSTTNFLALDEVQYSLLAGRHLKYIYDIWSEKGIKVIVAGSTSLDVKSKVSSFMVGRMLFFNLFPLSLDEFLQTKSDLYPWWINNHLAIGTIPKDLKPKSRAVKSAIRAYILFGGYPKIALANLAKKVTLLTNLYNSYVTKDVAGYFGIRDSLSFKRIVYQLSSYIGNLLNYTELSSASRLSAKTITSYLDILEQSYIIKRAFPFSKRPRQEIVKRPKVFFIDLGIRNAVANNFKLENQISTGGVIENYIFLRLSAQFKSVNYWRSRHGAEVDFVVEKEKT